MSRSNCAVRHSGTNLTDAELREIEMHISVGDALLAKRREKILREIDQENARLLDQIYANEAQRMSVLS